MLDKKRANIQKTKSISTNVVISLINTFISMVFPLITYPYVSRVLQVDNIGAINFGMSIIEYFGVIAAFGIGTFAIRNGSAIKDDSVKLQKFVSQAFSINVITTVISICLLIGMLFWSTKLREYRYIILIQSLTLIVSPLTLEWLYSIYEDFLYIAIRNLLVKTLSLIAVFVFVKTENDILVYVFITSISTVIVSIINFVHSRKYLYISFTFKNGWNIYKSALVVFLINSIASTIYLNSDKTMLGVFCDDKAVGLYTTATNIYMIVKRVVAAGVMVTIPRLSYYFQNDYKSFHSLVEKAVKIVVFVSIPMMAGLIILAPETIYIISGNGYENAKNPLIVLAIATIFASFANLFSNGVLVAQKKEKLVMRCTVISSVVNIALNFVMIPLFQETGAAVTTLLSEIIMATMTIYYSQMKVWDKTSILGFCKTIVATISMIIVCLFVRSICLNLNLFLKTIVVTVVGMFVFFFSAILLREEIMITTLNRFSMKVTQKNN